MRVRRKMLRINWTETAKEHHSVTINVGKENDDGCCKTKKWQTMY